MKKLTQKKIVTSMQTVIIKVVFHLVLRIQILQISTDFGDEAQKYMGSVEQFTNVDVGKGKIATKWSMTEPAFSFFAIFYEGIEQNLDMPHLGGMNKVKYVSTSDGFEQTLESEKFGKTHGIEKYSDEGVTMVSLEKFVDEFRKLTTFHLLLVFRLGHTKARVTLNFGRESSTKTGFIESRVMKIWRPT